MEVVAICPECSSRMVFRVRPSTRRTRLIARCEPCDATYSLYGGEMRAVQGTPEEAREPG